MRFNIQLWNWEINYFTDILRLASWLPAQVFSWEYCQMFQNTYFEKQLQTAASVHSVSKLEKWEMENIKLYKSDDLVSGIFRSSSSELLKKKFIL